MKYLIKGTNLMINIYNAEKHFKAGIVVLKPSRTAEGGLVSLYKG